MQFFAKYQNIITLRLKINKDNNVFFSWKKFRKKKNTQQDQAV